MNAATVTCVDGSPATAVFDVLDSADIPFAVVSNSPPRVVRVWLTAKGFDVPVFGSAGKPRTQGLRRALTSLGVSADQFGYCLLVDDGFDGARACLELGVWTATLTTRVELSEPPDHLVPSPGALLDQDALFSLAGDYDTPGLPALLTAALGPQAQGYCAGRYRTRNSGVPHRLSDLIVQSKSYGPTSRWPPELAETGKFLISEAMRNQDSTLLTAVPSSDGTLGRFQGLLSSIGHDLNVEVRPTLTWREPVRKQVKLHGSEERQSNVREKLRAVGDFAGKHVVVFDDVWTTGATAQEAGRALHENGAASVTIAALARTAWSKPTTPGHWIIPSDAAGKPTTTLTVKFDHDSSSYHCYRGEIDARATVLYASKANPELPTSLTLSIAPSQFGKWVLAERQPTAYKYDSDSAGRANKPSFVLLPDQLIESWGTPERIELRRQ